MSSSLQNNNRGNNDIEEGINTNTSPSSTSVEYSVPSNSSMQDATHRTATVPSIHANSMVTIPGPELIDADDEPPLPMKMEAALDTDTDTAKDEPELREGPELIDDNIGPDCSMDIESSFVDDKDAAAGTAGVEQIDDDSAPTPHDLTEFEEGVDAKKKADQATVYNEDSIHIIPTREDIEGESEFATTDTLQVEQVHRTIPTTTRESIESNLDVEVSREDNATPPTANGTTVSTGIINVNVDQAEDNANHVLPTAVWLPDEAVYDATPLEPTLPWWKQRRAKILLILLIAIAIVSALAIALGVSFSSERNSTEAEDVATNNANVEVEDTDTELFVKQGKPLFQPQT